MIQNMSKPRNASSDLNLSLFTVIVFMMTVLYQNPRTLETALCFRRPVLRDG